MRKIVFLVFLVCATAIVAKAQTPQVPNGSFENWSTATWGDSAASWTNEFSLLSPIILSKKSTSFHDGQFALEALSQSISVIINTYNIPGIATLGVIKPDLVNFSAKVEGGVPFNGKPASLKGWYQYEQHGSDSAIVYVVLTKWNPVSGSRDTVGVGGFVKTSSQATYTQFTAPITYVNQTLIPDSMNIILLSSGLAATPGSKFTVDELSFNYTQGVSTNKDSEISIYPNPTNGKLNIALEKSERTTISIYNALGQKSFSTITNELNTTIDLSSLPKGIYFLELQSGTSKITKKISLK